MDEVAFFVCGFVSCEPAIVVRVYGWFVVKGERRNEEDEEHSEEDEENMQRICVSKK